MVDVEDTARCRQCGSRLFVPKFAQLSHLQNLCDPRLTRGSMVFLFAQMPLVLLKRVVFAQPRSQIIASNSVVVRVREFCQ